MGSENPNFYQPRTGVIDWGRFKALPTVVAPFDPAAVNARLAPFRETPVRWRRGTFRVAQDATPAVYERARTAAVTAFVRAMEQQGWALTGRIQVCDSPYPVTDPDGNKQEGMREYVVRAMFRKLDFQPVRIDVSHLVQ